LSFPSQKVELSVEIDQEYQPIPGIVGPLRFSRDRDLNANVFCMYGLLRSQTQVLIDPRNFDFGDTFAVITDGDEFLRRVREAKTPKDQQVTFNLVDYVEPETHFGDMGIFKKFTHYRYQSEFRIALLPGTGEQFSLEIGDLSDITVIGRLKDVNKRIRIK